MRDYRFRPRLRNTSPPVTANRPTITSSMFVPFTAPAVHPAPVLGAIGVGVAAPGVRSPAVVLTGDGVTVGCGTVG